MQLFKQESKPSVGRRLQEGNFRKSFHAVTVTVQLCRVEPGNGFAVQHFEPQQSDDVFGQLAVSFAKFVLLVVQVPNGAFEPVKKSIAFC